MYQLRDKNSICGDSILAKFNNYRSYGMWKLFGTYNLNIANTHLKVVFLVSNDRLLVISKIKKIQS